MLGPICVTPKDVTVLAIIYHLRGRKYIKYIYLSDVELSHIPTSEFHTIPEFPQLGNSSETTCSELRQPAILSYCANIYLLAATTY